MMNYQEDFPLETIEPLTDPKTYNYIFSDRPENKAYYQKSMNQTVNAIMEHLENRKTPFSGASIEQIRNKFNHIVIENSDEGISLQESLDELKDLYLNDAISFHDPKYMAHLNCPILIPALAAEVIISAINSSMDTWDQSAGGTLIELKLIDWTLQKIGYPAHGDGVFTSGGTQSNLMGLLLARDHYIKTNYGMDAKLDGLPVDASKFRIFCSEVSHFSLKKNVSLLGLGQRSIVAVEVDHEFKMSMPALQKALKEQIALGNIPIAIVGTAGTTDFGSIDPLKDIAQVAHQHKVWFHVDAAYGGGLILSEQHKHKLNGIELSDSATIDYHKTFFQPVSSSGFFMRDKSFIDYIRYHADYLNSKEQEDEGVPNMVKKSIQTTRRFDALKLWLTLRTMGTQSLGQYIDDIIELANQSAALLRNDEEFELMNHPETSAIIFRHTFMGAEKMFMDENYCGLNSYIRKAMFNEGKAILTSTKVHNETYLKFTFLNPLTTLKDVQQVIALIKKHGQKYLENN